MFCYKKFLLSFVVFAFTGSLVTHAIVVDDYTTAEDDPANYYNSFNWDYIYNVNGSSGVAVDDYWLLTAHHVADDGPADLSSRTAQEIIYHDAADDPDNDNNADLALIRYDNEFPGSYNLYTGNFPSSGPNRVTGIAVGFGNTGTTRDSSYDTNSTGNGTKRWGTNTVDQTLEYNGSAETTNKGLQSYFDLNDSSYEAGLATFDSGGGIFVQVNSEWNLAGINTNNFGSSSDEEGEYGGFLSVSTQEYSTWINTTIPEPSSFLMLFLGAGVVASLGQILITQPAVEVLGASGAIFGILGTLTIISPRMPILLFFIVPLPLWTFTLGYGLLEAILAFTSSGGSIAHLAHFVGLLVGAGYGLIARRNIKNKSRDSFGSIMEMLEY